jgi:hypothetical protein
MERPRVYAVEVFGRGMVFADWAEAERWRERFQVPVAQTTVRRFPTVAEARRWLEQELGVPVVASWHVAAGGGGAAAGPPESAMDEEGEQVEGERAEVGAFQTRSRHVTRLSRTPFEIALAEQRPDTQSAYSTPGHRIALAASAKPSSVTVDLRLGGVGSGPEAEVAAAATTTTTTEARPTLLGMRHDPAALETAELRLSKDSRFPDFGFELVLPGNVLYASARNLSVRPALQQVASARGRQAAMLFEALNSDLGSVAVAVRVTSLDMSACLKQRVTAWRERGGKDAKGKPVADFGVLDSLERMVKERSLAVRVSDAQHAARMARLQVVGPDAGGTST